MTREGRALNPGSPLPYFWANESGLISGGHLWQRISAMSLRPPAEWGEAAPMIPLTSIEPAV